MFEQLRKEASFGSWAAQLCLAYVGPLAALMIASYRLSPGPDSPLRTLCEYVFIAVAGAALASVIATAFDATEGRLVWTVPAGLFFAVLAIEAHRNIRDLTYLFYAGAGEGEAGWLLFLLTIPTWGCCWYSLVMSLWRRRKNGKDATPPPME
jgi:hypothetical protein